MADGDIVQSFILNGVKEATDELNRLGAVGESIFNRIKSAADNAGNIGHSIDQIGDSAPKLQKVEKAAEDFGRSLGSTLRNAVDFTAQLGKMAAVAGGAAAASLFTMSKRAADVVDHLRDASLAAGTSVENIQKLGFAADQSGASIQGLQRAFGIIAQGEGQAQQALAKYGVQIRKTNGDARDSSEVFLDFADKIAQMQDPAQRSAAAAEVFGVRAGPRLVELLSQGRKGIEQFGKEATRLGIVFSTADTKIGDDFNDALSKLGATIGGVATRIGLAFGPTFIKIFDALTEAVAKVGPPIVSAAQAVADRLTPAIDSLLKLLGPTGLAVVSVAGGIGAFVLALRGAAAILGPFGGIVTAALAPFTLIGTTILSGVRLLTGSIGILTNGMRLLGLVSAASLGPIGIAVVALTAALGFLGVVLLRDVDFTGFGQRALAAVQSVLAAFQTAASTISAAWTGVNQFFTDLFLGIQQVATDSWSAISKVVSGAATAVTSAFSAVGQFFTDLWNGVASAAKSAFDTAKQLVSDLLSFVTSQVQPVLNFLGSIINRAQQAAAALSEATNTGGAGAPGFAHGGVVRGPGTSTSDSILARLSRGEFVVRAAAVDKYGVSLLNAINGMRLPLRSLRGFASGGLVSALQSTLPGPLPRFADGGLVDGGGGGRPVVLNIEGQSFNLRTQDEDTAERLVRHATSRRVRSAGRRPGYYGA